MTKDDKVLYEQIDDILWYDWDPIGVNYNEAIRDEYIGYTPHIFRLKKQNADVYKISQYLFSVVTIDMGMSGDTDLIMMECKRIAQNIIDL